MMTKQGDLFGLASPAGIIRVAHVRGSDTSYAAARSMDGPAASIRERVFQAIKAAGANGVTSDQLEATMGRHQTISARVRELSLLGRIMDTGRRRATRSGRKARVYVAKELAT